MEWTRQKTNSPGEFEVKACKMSDGEMKRVLRQTTPKRTTRIRGSVTVGDWTRTRGLAEEMTGEVYHLKVHETKVHELKVHERKRIQGIQAKLTISQVIKLWTPKKTLHIKLW